MTLSEFVQAWRIRELLNGRDGHGDPPPLECGDGTVLLVNAGAEVPGSYPVDVGDAGPWEAFSVRVIGGAVPEAIRCERANQRRDVMVPAGALVRLLEALGWPSNQLGPRWKKHALPVPDRR